MILNIWPGFIFMNSLLPLKKHIVAFNGSFSFSRVGFEM